MPKILRKTKSKPGATRLGALPEWDLSALYSGLDDPAIKRDLDRTDADCSAFEQAYKGKLAGLAAAPQGGAALGEAVRRYEAISDRMGRLGSYAVLIHEGDTVDPVHKILWRHAGADDRGLDAPVVLRARAQPHR